MESREVATKMSVTERGKLGTDIGARTWRPLTFPPPAIHDDDLDRFLPGHKEIGR